MGFLQMYFAYKNCSILYHAPFLFYDVCYMKMDKTTLLFFFPFANHAYEALILQETIIKQKGKL